MRWAKLVNVNFYYAIQFAMKEELLYTFKISSCNCHWQKVCFSPYKIFRGFSDKKSKNDRNKNSITLEMSFKTSHCGLLQWCKNASADTWQLTSTLTLAMKLRRVRAFSICQISVIQMLSQWHIILMSCYLSFSLVLCTIEFSKKCQSRGGKIDIKKKNRKIKSHTG